MAQNTMRAERSKEDLVISAGAQTKQHIVVSDGSQPLDTRHTEVLNFVHVATKTKGDPISHQKGNQHRRLTS